MWWILFTRYFGDVVDGSDAHVCPDYALYLETDEVDGHQYLVDLFESDG